MTGCVVCGSRERGPLYPGIVKCVSCGHVFADASLTDAELAAIYDRGYFFGEEYSDYVADRPLLERNFRLRLKVLNRYAGETGGKRLFEIGCAYGFFLNLVRGDYAAVSGVDISRDATEYARREMKLDVATGDFLSEGIDPGRCDVLCMWDAIEHLRDPGLYLDKAAGKIPRGGLIALTTGDIGGLNARLRGGSWRLLHPPTHLHYFSKRTISRLLNRFGFSVVYNRHCGFYRSVDNMAYNVLVLRRNMRRLYAALKASGVTSLNCYLNMFDIMYVIARRG